jgi:hypothetical protein
MVMHERNILIVLLTVIVSATSWSYSYGTRTSPDKTPLTIYSALDTLLTSEIIYPKYWDK